MSRRVLDSHYMGGVEVSYLDDTSTLLPPDGTPVFEIQETVTAKYGDSFYKLAYRHYNADVDDPRPYWALIALANPHIEDPITLTPGEQIRIPKFQKWPIKRY